LALRYSHAHCIAYEANVNLQTKAIALLALVTVSSLSAQNLDGPWRALGSAPAVDGQVEGISNREVTGAVQAVVVHPTNPDIIYIGAVNGGVWKTTNATSLAPRWTPLTDAQKVLSVGALNMDPLDTTWQTLVAGIGRTSSFGIGGESVGLLRSTDGGTTWTALRGSGTINFREIFSVLARGTTLVISTDAGLFRSTNGGTTFSNVLTTPAPNTRPLELIGDRVDNSRMFTAVSSSQSGAAVGIYRSDDAGATWRSISDAAINARLPGSQRVRLARGASNALFAAIANVQGQLVEVFRSPDLGDSWQSMGIPTTVEANGAVIGIHPGFAARLFLSLTADPSNSQVVYIGGDRQPRFNEGQSGGTSFPNSLGANTFSGRLFRGDASQAPAARWVALTHSGTANNSPHADSRAGAFDAAGNFIQIDDGGIYKRTQPSSNEGVWLSLNGDLQSGEFHSIAYDSLANRVIGGTQDNGVAQQTQTTNKIFNTLLRGDGGDVSVFDGSAPSLRYFSAQFLANPFRDSYDANNILQASFFMPLTVVDGSPAMNRWLVTPVVANEVDRNRLVIGASNGIYESFDQGNTVSRSSTLAVTPRGGSPLVYGVTGNPDFLFFAALNDVYLRTAAPPAAPVLVRQMGNPASDLAVNPNNSSELFALSRNEVLYSNNAGASFQSIVGNLPVPGSASIDVAPGEMFSLAFIPAPDAALVVGGAQGVFVARASSGYSNWRLLGAGLPNALMHDLDYDIADQALIAGSLGRGVWRMNINLDVDLVFRDGFE
jgi:hypothetical protein